MIKKLLRVCITIASLVFLVWFILPFVKYGILNPGNILGALICLYLIFRFGFKKIYNSFKEFFLKRKFTKFLWYVVNTVFAIFAVYAIVISSLMISFSLNAPASNSSTTAIVLGAQVKPWGASALLQQRINAAYKYLKEHPKAYAIATGGQGSDEPMSETQCIYENLVKRGIDKSRIIIEDKAKNTKENIKFSYDIMSKNSKLGKDTAIITDNYHQLRSQLIARKQGVTSEIRSVNTENGIIGIICYPTMFVREWLAIPVEIIK